MGRTVFAEVPEAAGSPHGMTTDGAGRLYSAHWQGARISVYDPDGRIVEVIPLPANNVTSCAFGGGDGSLLFVTGAALEDGAGPEAPHGDVFVLSGGAKGRPEPAFDPALLGERGTRTPSMGKERSAIDAPPMRAAPSPPGASP